MHPFNWRHCKLASPLTVHQNSTQIPIPLLTVVSCFVACQEQRFKMGTHYVWMSLYLFMLYFSLSVRSYFPQKSKLVTKFTNFNRKNVGKSLAHTVEFAEIYSHTFLGKIP